MHGREGFQKIALEAGESKISEANSTQFNLWKWVAENKQTIKPLLS